MSKNSVKAEELLEENELVESNAENIVTEKVEIPEETKKEVVVEKKKIEVEVMAVSETQKINLTKYLRLYPQSTYVAAYLKKFYAAKAMTVNEWNKVVEDFLNSKI